MSLDTILTLLAVSAAAGTALTEFLKNLISIPSNLLAGISALIVSVVLGCGYCILNSLSFNLITAAAVLGLWLLTWLCSMVGYDKVVQAIEQLDNTEEEG